MEGGREGGMTQEHTYLHYRLLWDNLLEVERKICQDTTVYTQQIQIQRGTDK